MSSSPSSFRYHAAALGKASLNFNHHLDRRQGPPGPFPRPTSPPGQDTSTLSPQSTSLTSSVPTNPSESTVSSIAIVAAPSISSSDSSSPAIETTSSSSSKLPMILGIAGGLLAICIVIVSALIIRSRQRKLKPPPLGSFDDTKPAVAFPQNRPAASSLQRGKAYDDNSPSLVSIHVETSPAASWTGHELENAMTVASGGQLAPAPPAVVIASTLSRYSQQSQQSSRNMPGPVEEEESDDEEPTAADVVKVVLQNEGVVSEAGALPPGYDKVVGSLHKVVLEYTPTFEDELYLNIDDEVVLNHLFEDGWGRGTNLTTGKNGVFPVMCISEKALSDKVLTENHISRADQAETAIMRKPTISSDKLPKRSTSLSKPEFSI